MTISNLRKDPNLLPTTALHQVNCENTPLFWILSAGTASNKHPLIHEKYFSLMVDLGQVPPPLVASYKSAVQFVQSHHKSQQLPKTAVKSPQCVAFIQHSFIINTVFLHYIPECSNKKGKVNESWIPIMVDQPVIACRLDFGLINSGYTGSKCMLFEGWNL